MSTTAATTAGTTTPATTTSSTHSETTGMSTTAATTAGTTTPATTTSSTHSETTGMSTTASTTAGTTTPATTTSSTHSQTTGISTTAPTTAGTTTPATTTSSTHPETAGISATAATTAGTTRPATTTSSTHPETTGISSTAPTTTRTTTTGTTTSSTHAVTTGISSTAPTTTRTTTTGTATSSTHVVTTGVLQCNPVCADNELCTNSAGYTECKCQRIKYINASRSDILPTVQCEGSAMTLSLDKCLLERLKYSLSQMYFADRNCTATTSLRLVGNERVAQVKAVPQRGWCGNTLAINNYKMTYSNALYIAPNNQSGITVGSILRLNFSCTYNMTMQISLLTALHPIIGTVSLPPVNGSGPITATMAAFKSNSFADPLTEGDTLTVGTPVYIGISTSFLDGDTFTLRADRCVAAPSNNPADLGVELIADGCAVTQDVNVHVLQNGQSLVVMFEIETFIFKELSQVYLRCDVSLCQIKPSNTCQCSSSSRSAKNTVTIEMAPIGISGYLDINSGSHADISFLAVVGSSMLALLSLWLM
ncbi:uromodulin-like [Pleurodeles waltl]